MGEILLNNEYRLSFPDDFHVMDEKERSELKFLAEGEGDCISDPEHHLLITTGWKQAGKVVLFLLNPDDLARQMEKAVADSMKESGYRHNSYTKRTISGMKACGFSYSYTAEGIEMLGESFAFKDKKAIYYIHMYTRKTMANENMKTWNSILEGITK